METSDPPSTDHEESHSRATPPEADHRDHPDRIDTSNICFIIVHGIGDQPDLAPVRAFAATCGETAQNQTALSRARFAALRDDETLLIRLDDASLNFAEINYADSLDDYIEDAEESVGQWLHLLRYEVARLNRKKGGRRMDLGSLETAVADTLLGTKIAQFLAERTQLVQVGPIQEQARRLVQQVQLYIDHDGYRSAVDDRFDARIQKIVDGAEQEGLRCVLVAHSLGTVVALRGLLRGHSTGATWLSRIDRFVTMGSPIDLFLICYGELFDYKPTAPTERPGIAWTNYVFSSDPIASTLDSCRSWLKENHHDLFRQDAPAEVDLGPGGIVTAHVDYWTSKAMVDDLQASNWQVDHERTGPRLFRRTTALTVGRHLLALWCGALLTAWWAENLKGNNAERAFFGAPLNTLIAYALAYLVVVCHTRTIGIGSFSINSAILSALATAVAGAVLLTVVLPPLPLIVDEMEWLGSAFVGAALSFSMFAGGLRLPRTQAGLALLLGAVALTLLVGTRTDPANVFEELDTIVPMFLIWWLAAIMARLDWLWGQFIGRKRHIALLRTAWGPAPSRPAIRRFLAQPSAGAVGLTRVVQWLAYLSLAVLGLVTLFVIVILVIEFAGWQ